MIILLKITSDKKKKKKKGAEKEATFKKEIRNESRSNLKYHAARDPRETRKGMVVNAPVALTFHVARERVSCNKESLLEGGERRRRRAEKIERIPLVSSRDKATFSTFERSAGHRTSEWK